MNDVLIIGAGLSGLFAAHVLGDMQVTLLDKGRSVGGRMATRRINGGHADHGAQFFTARTDAFHQYIDAWLTQGIVEVWARGWGDEDGHPRYVAAEGMNALTKHIAHNLTTADIHTSTRAEKVDRAETFWRVTDTDGGLHEARALVLTSPVPQSLALLDAVSLDTGDQATLEGITYEPCLCGLFHVDGKVGFPEPGAVYQPEATFRWMADNTQKGISPEARIITVHAAGPWSADHWDDDPDDLLAEMWAAVQEYAPADTGIVEQQLKKWRYSKPDDTTAERVLVAKNLPPLVFAGDAFGGPRVEGAVLSGMAAGERIRELLTP